MLGSMLQNPKLPALWCRFRANASGTSAIEFAMLAPLFILLLLGMVAYGIYFGASHSVQQIAADAARTAIAGLNATERKTLVTNFINNDVNGYPFVDATKLTVDASDTAVEFFKKRGYVAQQRNSVPRHGEWLANTTMQKQLAPSAGAPQ